LLTWLSDSNRPWRPVDDTDSQIKEKFLVQQMTNRTGEGGGIQTKILGISKNEKIKDIQVLISEWSNPLL
jgi:hypothetical protein